MADITRKKHLNPRRRNRTYPRVVKRARHNSYRVKRPGDHGTHHPGPLRLMPGASKQLTAVAHTLPYDAALVQPYQTGRPLPPGQWAAVTMPILAMCGDAKESPGLLRHGSAAVACALPNGRLVQRRGLGHAKKLTPAVIAATLTEFLTSPEPRATTPGPGRTTP